MEKDCPRLLYESNTKVQHGDNVYFNSMIFLEHVIVHSMLQVSGSINIVDIG